MGRWHAGVVLVGLDHGEVGAIAGLKAIVGVQHELRVVDAVVVSGGTEIKPLVAILNILVGGGVFGKYPHELNTRVVEVDADTGALGTGRDRLGTRVLNLTDEVLRRGTGETSTLLLGDIEVVAPKVGGREVDVGD